MRTIHRRLGRAALLAGVGLAAAGGGCQTYFGGMTLPSPHYLKHPPQYFEKDPTFPLQREYDSMLDPDGAARRGAAVPALPALPAAPVGGVPAPQQASPPAGGGMAAPAGGRN